MNRQNPRGPGWRANPGLKFATNSRWVMLLPINTRHIAISSGLVPPVDLGRAYTYVANDIGYFVLTRIDRRRSALQRISPSYKIFEALASFVVLVRLPTGDRLSSIRCWHAIVPSSSCLYPGCLSHMRLVAPAWFY